MRARSFVIYSYPSHGDTRVDRLLARQGLTLAASDGDAPDPLAEHAPALAALCAGSVVGRSVLGRVAGARVARIGSDPEAYTAKPETPWHARHASFDLHAGRTVRADDREGLERLCHYLLRPPLAQERIEILADGRVGVTLAHPWADGTRALVFTSVEFLEKLAVLIPKPRVNLLLYHGVLASRARHRAAALGTMRSSSAAPVASQVAAPAPATIAAIVAPGLPQVPGASMPHADVAEMCGGPSGSSGPPPRPPRRHFAWGELLRRIFAIDVLACTCGGRLRFIATIEDPPVVERILRHLGKPTQYPNPLRHDRRRPGPSCRSTSPS
jgi:hypothetical protein